jgi:hypothetical protein
MKSEVGGRVRGMEGTIREKEERSEERRGNREGRIKCKDQMDN